MKKIFLTGPLTLCLLATNAFASGEADAFWSGPTRIYANVGTQGVGLGLAKPLTPEIDVRANFSTLSFARSVVGDSLETEAKLNLSNLGLYADYFPFNSGFRLTGGVQTGKNQVELKSKASGTVTVNNTQYVGGANDNITGRLDLSSTAPYLGLGYSSHGVGSAGLSLNFDVGVRLGNADVSLTRNGFTALPAVLQTQLDKDLLVEQTKLQDSLNVLRTFPVISLGVSYVW